MSELNIPILQKSFTLYKHFHDYRRLVPKADRFTIYERGEKFILNVIELLVEAVYATRNERIIILKRANVKLNILRFLVRLMWEGHVLDIKKYIVLQETVDEIGRMLGGWMRASVNQ